MKICGIYYIINKIDNKIYVGSSNNIYNRFYRHKRRLNNNNHDNPHLQLAWNKYGKDNFYLQIIEECPREVLLLKEQTYLDTARNNKKDYYNINFVSTKPPSPKGRKMSEETKRKLSILRTGPNNPQYGKKLSEVTKRKMSISHSRNYSFISPYGKVVNIYNLNKFCRDNNLNAGGMFGVHKGRYKQYKGWKKYSFQKSEYIYT